MSSLEKSIPVWALALIVASSSLAQQPGQQALGQTQVQQSGQAGQQQIVIPTQLMDPEAAVQAGLAQVPQQPFEALNEREQQYLDDVLKVWEGRTAQVKRYSCEFTRWEFTPNQEAYESIAKGILKYMDPDKGLFMIDQVETIASKPPNPPEYKVDPRNPMGEYWICDGDWVHILDRNEKKALRIQLPPEMRGKGIYQSPLPFLFGVNANEIKRRYWIHPVTPPTGDDGVWLEAFPKRADDAGNYYKVQIILDRKDILPRALIVFLPNWRPDQRHQEIYEFTNRQDSASMMDALKESIFRKEFIPTKLPSDWNVIEEPYMPPQDVATLGQGSPNPTPQQRMAQPPATGQQPIRR